LELKGKKMKQEQTENFLTLNEVATLLGISVQEVKQLNAQSNNLPIHKIAGCLYRISITNLFNFLVLKTRECFRLEKRLDEISKANAALQVMLAALKK